MTDKYITRPTAFPLNGKLPWNQIKSLQETIEKLILALDDDYDIRDGVAIHKTVVRRLELVEQDPL